VVIICENFTLSEVEMPHLRHLRAFKTASQIGFRAYFQHEGAILSLLSFLMLHIYARIRR